MRCIFICALEILHMEFRTGCPERILYADELALVCRTLEKLLVKFKIWRDTIESKGLRVNITKTKVISGCSVVNIPKRGKYPTQFVEGGSDAIQ